MITIVDYGLGNLNSIKNMLRRLGYDAKIAGEPSELLKAKKLILPGVGSFDNGMRNIRSNGLENVLKRKVLDEKTPVLGICLGMQLLADSSEEGKEKGLGWIPGRAEFFCFPPGEKQLKVPHMGWNTVAANRDDPLIAGFYPEMRFYFVHSYHVVCDQPDDVLLTTEYGGLVTAAVRRENIMGTQFHPEKSHKYGMLILKNFAEL